MTTEAWLRSATSHLSTAGIATARLDALVLLEDCLGVDRALLLARPDQILETTQTAKLKKLLKRRAVHEPLAYIRGHSEFYGRNFVITPAVLEPRPETETMIDLLGELSATGELAFKPPKTVQNEERTLKIADIGTGSGAVGITAQVEFPKSQKVTVDLLELDPKALEIAKINVDKHTTGIRCLRSDLLAGSNQNYDVLLCNLPYVPDDYPVNEAVRYEPEIAVFGGPDGLDLYRKLFQQLKHRPQRPLFILCEALPAQHQALLDLAASCGYDLWRTEGLIQVFQLATPN